MKRNQKDYYTSGPCCGQVRPDTPTHDLIKRLYAELDAEHFGHQPEPKGYRMIEDAGGFPMPLYDPPAIRCQ